jgi:ribosomal protein L9
MYKEFELEKRRQAKREKLLVTEAEEVAAKLQDLSSVTVEVNTNEEGHLYGSVTPSMVAEALLGQGLKIEPRLVEIEEPIKQVGVYEIQVRLFKEVCPKVKIWVVSSKTLESLTPVKEGERKEPGGAAEEKPAEEGAPAENGEKAQE